MFHLINIGKRAGSGIPNIYSVWKRQGWNEPQIIEEFEPERITLILSYKKSAINQNKKQKIIDYLKGHDIARTSELADMLGLQPSRTRDYITDLIKEGIVVSDGENKNKVYKLK